MTARDHGSPARRPSLRPWTVLFLSVLLAASASCRRKAAVPQATLPDCAERARQTQRSLEEFRGPDGQRVRRSLARAKDWLDGITVDPVDLSKRGLLGKQRLAELLSGYYDLWKASSASEREALTPRIHQLLQPVRRPEFHDMLAIAPETFNQESSSYLWIAYMMERMGEDVSDYRKSILGLRSRLDQRLLEGGPQVRKIFEWHYRTFGLPWPSALGDARRRFIITLRPDFRGFDRDLVYRLTHEVLALYSYGDGLGEDHLSEAELRYLRRALYWLTRTYVAKGDTDIVAELATCLRLVRSLDLPVLAEALSHLLNTQTPSGAWGHYETTRKERGAEAERLLQLHTTVVSAQALLLAFHPPWNEAATARCPDETDAR